MQTAVLAGPFPSVRPSVTFRYCVQTNEDMIVRFSASGRTIPLISEEAKYIRIFAAAAVNLKYILYNFLKLF